MRDVRLSVEADADLDRLYVFSFERFGETQANDYFAGLLARFRQIARYPKMYQRADIGADIRQSVYHAHSIFYRCDEDGVLIVRILSREDRERALEESKP